MTVKEIFDARGDFNIVMMQNVDIIIEASRLLKEDKSIWFHIFGEGTYKKTLIDKTIEYGIKNILEAVSVI